MADVSLHDVLEECFHNQPFTFSIENKTIIVREKSISNIVPVRFIIIKGKVTNAKGEPLTGVSIKLRDSSIGAATDTNGEYSINVSNADGTLQFSYIGFKNQEVLIKGRTTINVVLGDQIDGEVQWKSGKTIKDLAGKTVRIKFIAKDADIYSFGIF